MRACNDRVIVTLLAALLGAKGWLFWTIFVYVFFADFFFLVRPLPLLAFHSLADNDLVRAATLPPTSVPTRTGHVAAGPQPVGCRARSWTPHDPHLLPLCHRADTGTQHGLPRVDLRLKCSQLCIRLDRFAGPSRMS